MSPRRAGTGLRGGGGIVRRPPGAFTPQMVALKPQEGEFTPLRLAATGRHGLPSPLRSFGRNPVVGEFECFV